MFAAGDVIAGAFRLVTPLGSGGQAAVFEAEDLRRGGRVAIKLLPAGDEKVRARFEREAKLLMRLKSPSIVEIFDYGTTDSGEHYLAMERLEGRTLAAELRAHGALGWTELAPIVLPVCEALAIAHANGIIHRDIKPANIFVVSTPSGKEGRLLDFGIARDVEATALTTTGNIIGTPRYMAPEQIFDGRRTDARSDIYALGLVVYEALAGAPAYANGGVDDLLEMMDKGPPPLEVAAPGISPELARAVMAAIDLEPTLRPARVEAFAASLIAATARAKVPSARVHTTAAVEPVAAPVRPIDPPPSSLHRSPVDSGASVCPPPADRPSADRPRWVIFVASAGASTVIGAIAIALSRVILPGPASPGPSASAPARPAVRTTESTAEGTPSDPGELPSEEARPSAAPSPKTARPPTAAGARGTDPATGGSKRVAAVGSFLVNGSDAEAKAKDWIARHRPALLACVPVLPCPGGFTWTVDRTGPSSYGACPPTGAADACLRRVATQDPPACFDGCTPTGCSLTLRFYAE